MKTIYKIKYYLLSAGILFSLAACSDFLDHPLTNGVSDDNIGEVIVSDPTVIDKFLGNAYRTFAGINLYGRHIQYVLNGLSHEVDIDWIAEIQRNEFCMNGVTSTNQILYSNVYTGYYSVLATLNTVMDLIDKLDLSEFSDTDAARIRNNKGEIQFLRAFTHFDLLRLFGENGPHFGGSYPNNKDAQGIVLAMVLTTAENAFSSRSTIEECYQAILQDLKEAEQIIGNNQIPANDKIQGGTTDTDYTKDTGWAQLPAVKALLGKVYLYMNDYSNAKTYFEAVISDTRFKLDKPVNFTDYIQHADNNAECIFTLQYYHYTGPADPYSGAPNHMINRIFGNVPGAWSNFFIDSRNPARFGDDPRLYEAMLYDYTWKEWTGAEYEFEKVDPTAENFRSFPRKLIDFFNTASPRDNTKNIDLIRLADVYLMYAETLLQTGNTSEATEYVNKVRRRAWGEADYNVAGTKGEDLANVTLKTIQDERYKELFFENHRWFDMCRWGIVAEELALYPSNRAGTIHYDDHDYYMPIPESELKANPNLKQSKGY